MVLAPIDGQAELTEVMQILKCKIGLYPGARVRKYDVAASNMSTTSSESRVTPHD